MKPGPLNTLKQAIDDAWAFAQNRDRASKDRSMDAAYIEYRSLYMRKLKFVKSRVELSGLDPVKAALGPEYAARLDALLLAGQYGTPTLEPKTSDQVVESLLSQG